MIRQADVTRATKAAVQACKACGLPVGSVVVSIADGAVNVRIEPPAESAAPRPHGEIEDLTAKVAAYARRTAQGR